MPLYDFKCGACSHADVEYQKMGMPAVQNCPKCMAFEYIRQVSLPNTDLKEFHKPIHMFSIAANTEEEIAQLRKDCPDLEISSDPKDELYGVPVARNRKQKLDALKSVGYVEKN